MLLGFNMLLWTPFVTEQHLPLFERLKKTGYDGVELPLFEGTPEHYRRIGQALRDNGLRCTGIAVIPDEVHSCASSTPQCRQAGLAHIKWATDCLQAAGGNLLCGPFYHPLGMFSGMPPTPDEIGFVAEVHKEAALYAGARNMRLAVEPLNRFETYLLNTVSSAADLVRQVAEPNYGLLYDSFHANIEEKDPVGVIGPWIGQISHVHLSENDRGTPGKGHIPWAATLAAFREAGYEGWFVIEAFGRSLPQVAAATRIWRDVSPSTEEVFQHGHDFLRGQWAQVSTADT